MARRDVKFFEQHFLFSNRLVQIILRLRSNENSKNQYLSLCVLFFYFIPMTVNLAYELLKIDFNLDKTVTELRKVIGGLIMFSAYSSTYFHHLTLKLLLSRITKDLEELSHQEELQIMEMYNKENKLYTYVIIVLFSFYVISITFSCYFKVLLYFFGILNSNQLTLLLGFNNILNAGTLYYCLLIYQTIGFYMLLIIGIVFFTTYLVIVQHACCQFSIIICKIQRMFKSDREYVLRSLDQEIITLNEFNWIVDIIISFRKLTEYIDSINYYSHVIYLILVSISMLLVVLDFIYIRQLSITFQNLPKIIEFSIYIAGSLFTIYINFYIGQKLLNFSETVFKELCQVPFYLLSKETQYNLIFLIRRSLKPCMLSIGGLYISSHESFSGLMQKAFSFAMVYSSIK